MNSKSTLRVSKAFGAVQEGGQVVMQMIRFSGEKAFVIFIVVAS
jgi:hypothetical protein